MAELVARRYATAFFEVLKEEDSLDKAYEEFTFVKDLIEKENQFEILLESPRLNQDEKKDMLKEVFEGKVDNRLLGLLYLLIDKQRINHLEGIYSEFRRLYDIENNKIKATAVTVVGMNDKAKISLKNLLEEKLGKSIELENKVDKNIIGGVQLRIGDKVIDGSIKRKIDLLRESLLNVRVTQ